LWGRRQSVVASRPSIHYSSLTATGASTSSLAFFVRFDRVGVGRFALGSAIQSAK
jgi:hypothetical protein